MTPLDRQTWFQELIHEHRGILYRIVYTYCPDPADREDLVQEMTLQLWRSFTRFDGRGKFSTWMYRICLNVAISHGRRERRRTRRLIPEGDRFLEGVEDLPPDSEDVRRLMDYVQALDPLNRALILLYLDGNSYRDIAEVLGISETNVATKLNRLKNRMRRDLSPSEHEEG